MTMTDAAKKWLRTSKYSDAFVYHRGLLVADRATRTIPGLGSALRVVPAVDAVASLMWDAYAEGYVHLKQARVEPGVFDYIAERSRKR